MCIPSSIDIIRILLIEGLLVTGYLQHCDQNCNLFLDMAWYAHRQNKLIDKIVCRCLRCESAKWYIIIVTNNSSDRFVVDCLGAIARKLTLPPVACPPVCLGFSSARPHLGSCTPLQHASFHWPIETTAASPSAEMNVGWRKDREIKGKMNQKLLCPTLYTWSTGCADGMSCLLHSNSRGSPLTVGLLRHSTKASRTLFTSSSEQQLSTTNICVYVVDECVYIELLMCICPLWEELGVVNGCHTQKGTITGCHKSPTLEIWVWYLW